MKTLLLSLISAALFAQTVVTVPFTLPNAAIADALTWNRGQVGATQATLTAGINAAVTTFTLSDATGYTATDIFLNAGATLLVDSEEITCTSLVGAVYSGCTRAQQSTVAAIHATGASVRQMKYATNSSLLKALLLPGLVSAIQSLGPASTHLAALAAQVTTDQVTLNNALAAATLVK